MTLTYTKILSIWDDSSKILNDLNFILMNNVVFENVNNFAHK